VNSSFRRKVAVGMLNDDEKRRSERGADSSGATVESGIMRG